MQKINTMLPAISNPPQVMLFETPSSFNIMLFVNNFIKDMLCEKHTQHATHCDDCVHCNLLNTHAHPDVFNLSLEKNLYDMKNINIDLTRRLIDFLSLKPNFTKYKIIIIEDMEQLNINSANSLLKTLEEPPMYALFFLITHNAQSILPTILSRAQKFTINPNTSFPRNRESIFLTTNVCNIPQLDEQILIDILIKPSVENVFTAIDILHQKNVSLLLVLEYIMSWLVVLNSYIATSSLLNYPHYQKYTTQIKSLTQKINKTNIFYLFDEIALLLKFSTHNLNYKIQLENVLFKYQQLYLTS